MLAARSHALRKRDRDRGLADGRGTKDRYHSGGHSRSIFRGMNVRIGCGLSTTGDARLGAIEAAQAAGAGLGGERAQLALTFVSGAHLAAPEATLEGVAEALAVDAVVGCGAAGVLGEAREVEGATAVAVWAASFGDGEVETFETTASEGEDGVEIEGMPAVDDASAVILFADPYSFPTDVLLSQLRAEGSPPPVLGGLSSARTLEGTAALLHGSYVRESGAVGAVLRGVELWPGVSQGAAPLGPEMTITAAEGNVIWELAGKPALAKLREVLGALPAAEQSLAAGGLLVGLVIDAGKPEYTRGDFLVRGLLGADPETGYLSVGESVHAGQVVRLHARDAQSADADLRALLAEQRAALNGRAPAGALLFTCNGRGQAMFGEANHDAGALAELLDGTPTAGFFAAGEIGPVGSASFLHGFTATVGLFPQ